MNLLERPIPLLFLPYKESIPSISSPHYEPKITEAETPDLKIASVSHNQLAMDGRFFGIRRGHHRPAYYYSAVPVHRQTPTRSPKVVSIPVHFVESEPTRIRTRLRLEMAVKIQAAFRGFIVRKYVRKLDVVRREVEEIERRIYEEEETVEVMRSDERERLKVNEALMSLLFRLDSVRGVDAGVRELRKRVFKKAIALQEKVDATAAAANLADQKGGGAVEVERSEEGGVDSPDQEEADADLIEEQVADLPDQEEGGSVIEADVLDQKVECGETEQTEDHDIDLQDQEEGGIAEQVEESSSEGSDHASGNVNDACDLTMQMELAVFETSGESQSDPSLNPESFLEEEVDENAPAKEEDEAESLEEKAAEEEAEENKDSGHDYHRSEEMLGKMMEDNEKMMGMMTQLFDRNERQTQLLSMLSQRVERLEKAFVCEKRKKKRQAGFGDRSRGSNMCGKKS